MTEIEQHLQTIAVMKCQHSHIRKNDAEWAAMEAAEDALHRTAEDDRLEREGLLVRLPCRVGERWLDTHGNEIEVDALHCDSLAGWSIAYHYTDGENCACNPKYFAGHYTRQEAEAALGGGEGG